MYSLFIIVHIFICIALMIAVLLQSAKGEGLAGAFGGSSLTGTVFGGRGAAPVLAKATSGLAVAFFVSCIVLTFLSPSRRVAAVSGETAESAVERAARERSGELPVQVVPPDEVPLQGTEQQEPAQLPPPEQPGDQQQQPQQQQQPEQPEPSEGSGGSSGGQ